MIATLARPARALTCALVCAAALLFGLSSAAHADAPVAPAAVQNLETDASFWTSETYTDIDWDDPPSAAANPVPIADALYTVDGSPASGAPVQTSSGDTGFLELSEPARRHPSRLGVARGRRRERGPVDRAGGHRLHRQHAAADQCRQRDRLCRRHDQLSRLRRAVGRGSRLGRRRGDQPRGSDDEDLGGDIDNGTIVADLPDYADSGNRWTFSVSAADLAGNYVTTSFAVTLKPPPSTGSGGSGGSGSSGGSAAPKGSAAKITVAVTGHTVRGHVPTSDQPMAFIVYQIHGKRLKLLKAGRTAKTGDFNLHFGAQVSGSFKVLAGPYEARFTIKKAAKAPGG